MEKLNIDQIPDLDKRYNNMWDGNFYPHHIDQGYWPTAQESGTIGGIIYSSEMMNSLRKRLGRNNTWRIIVRWCEKPFYLWMNENFLNYCENYQKPITRELLKKAFEDFLEEIAIPWLSSEENKELTNDELREKY